MTEKEAFKIVLQELQKCNLFTGKYDARNGDDHFMHGVATVMESIAYHVSDDVGDVFSDLFTRNLIESEKKNPSFYINFSSTMRVKAKDVEEAYHKFYKWLDAIPEDETITMRQIIVDDDQLRPEEELSAE